jgi:hypothetical protein
MHKAKRQVIRDGGIRKEKSKACLLLRTEENHLVSQLNFRREIVRGPEVHSYRSPGRTGKNVSVKANTQQVASIHLMSERLPRFTNQTHTHTHSPVWAYVDPMRFNSIRRSWHLPVATETEDTVDQ